VTDAGDVIPGAEYTVINENTGVAAPIYSDRTGATLLTAPYFADSVGTIQFFIAQGTTFRVAASGGVGTYTDRYVYGVAGAVLTDASGSVDDGGSNPLAISRDGGTDENTSIRFKQLSTSWYAGVNSNNNFGFDTDPDLTNSLFQITPAGNVGIGTSSPSGAAGTTLAINGGANQARIALKNTSTGDASGDGLQLYIADTSAGIELKEAIPLVFKTSNIERMQLDSAGNLLLGRTTLISFGLNTTSGIVIKPNRFDVASDSVCRITQLTNSSGTFDRFYIGSGIVGSITGSGTSTAYNTSSDYRLKEDDVPMTGATERVKALRPINFAWKADGSRVDGFFAHELAEIVPEAATGTKDAMMDEEYEVTPAVYEDVTTPAVEAVLDEDGVVITEAVEESTESVLVTEAVMGTRSVPDYQGIDQSKLVPLLTATIQELIARIEALESGA